MQDQGQSRAYPKGARRPEPRLPGAWLAAIIAGSSALTVLYWTRTGVEAATRRAPATATRIKEVGPGEMADALETVAGSPEQLAGFREREGCERRLAWVTVVRSPGQPPGRIRLQSGRYLSPAFDLGETPARVALPFPAPYPTGQGMISVLGTTADAVVALTPPWHVTTQAGAHSVQVTWAPVGCPAAAK